MGVPGFFAWLLNKNQNILVDNTNCDIDIFYIDANCLFHPICFEIIKKYPQLKNKELEKKMITEIIKYIKYLIDYVSATQIFIAVDGVAPMAKISQQQKRRYKSMIETEIKNKIKEKYGIFTTNNWTNASITPGTLFMKKLHNALKSEFKDDNMVYSSYKEHGEGEHKILENMNTLKNKNIVIYGLDADLIFLSLTNHKNNIYLLREKNQINNIESETNLIYASMEITRNFYSEYITKYTSSYFNSFIKYDKINLINDFIFTCFLLGNDFLPHLEEINIKNDGLDILIYSYITTFLKQKKYIVTIDKTHKIKLNNKFIFELIKTIYDIPQKIRKYNKKVYMGNSDMDKELFDVDNLNTIDRKYMVDYILNDPIDYYNTYFNNVQDKNEIIIKYLHGLLWIANYYFNKCISWSWYYPYLKAPLLNDLIQFIDQNSFDINNIIFDDDGVMKVSKQVGLIIPHKYNKILPKKFRKESEKYDVKIDVTGKDLLWKCDVILVKK